MEPPPPAPRSRLAGLNPDALLAQALGSGPASGPTPAIPGIEILRPLGRGGMGEVYLGRQTGLDRLVAVKRVAAELQADPLMAGRLEREARLMASLRHPHVVLPHLLCPLPDGGLALVMEYVEGGTLRDRLEASPDGLPPDLCLRWAREIASALQAAHAAGVFHRDLKPENILLDPQDAARVTDFGLARSAHDPGLRLTHTGTAAGTLDYMAPEQRMDREPDARADVYSLGVVLYEMLTGRVPRGNFDPPRRVRPDTPAFLSEATLRALRSDPADRFPTMADFAAALAGTAQADRRRLLLVLAGGIGVTLALVFPLPRTRPTRTRSALPSPAPVHPPQPAPETPPPSADWVDLLPSASLPGSMISGGWTRNGTAWESDDSICILGLAAAHPPACDVRLRFTRLAGQHSIALFFSANGGVGTVDIDGWGLGLCGVQRIGEQDLRQSGGFVNVLENQRPYELRVEIRPSRVRIHLDGVLKADTLLGTSPLSVVAPWAWRATAPFALAIGSYQSPARFDRVEWRIPPTGDGESE